MCTQTYVVLLEFVGIKSTMRRKNYMESSSTNSDWFEYASGLGFVCPTLSFTKALWWWEASFLCGSYSLS